MRFATSAASLHPIVCTLAMFSAIVSGSASTIRPVLLATVLSSLVLGYSLARWPTLAAPRWQIWPMARSWLGLATLALILVPFGYTDPIRGVGALCLLALLPAEIARWVGSYRKAMQHLRGL